VPARFYQKLLHPMQLLTFALVLALAFVPLMGAVAGNMYQSFVQVSAGEIRLQQLIGTISHLIETLTLSAQMAAVTGDPAWETRYREVESGLDQALAEVGVAAREEYAKSYASQTKMAYTKIIEMESLAFALVRTGRVAEASKLLSSSEYEQAKSKYFQGIHDLTRGIQERIAREISSLYKRFWLVCILGILAVSALILAWAGVVVLLRKHFAKCRCVEEALAAEKERLDVTLGSIGDGVIATDIHANIVMMNPIAEQLTGWPLGEAAGRGLEEVFHIINENSRKRCENPVERVLSSGRICGLANHTVLISRDGTERIISDSGAPIRGRDGVVVGAVLVFRDATAQARLEAELLKAEKLESIGILAGGIAHDFNNILTAILGYLTLARTSLGSQNELFHELLEAEKATLRAADLTHQLLTFSKGGSPIKKTVRIDHLLIEWVTFALRGSNVRCEFEFCKCSCPVDVDQGQLSQVVNNLVINADQAMPNGGTISVVTDRVSIEEAQPLVLAPGDYLRISFRDQGVGIEKDHLGRIFDPYFTTKQSGAGLGLATSYSIMKRHNGLITVESEIGAGTAFHLYLPASSAVVRAQRNRETAPSLGQGKILLMDDDATIRGLAQELLVILGYEVHLAVDGHEATRSYAEASASGRPFDAVILDLTVPGGMGGKEAIQMLRDQDRNVRAIVSSGYSNDPVMATYEQHGFRGVLVKPYGVQEISEVLRSVLGDGNGGIPHVSTN